MKAVAFTLFALLTSWCSAQDVASELAILRTNYDLAPLKSDAKKGVFAFYVFVRPALSDSEYALSGNVRVTEKEISGSLTLLVPASTKAPAQVFSLSRSQVLEVYSWFSDAKFLDPKIDETVPARVLDGVELVIEGMVDGRHFQLRRNAYDSLKTQGFFMQVESFRIWKEGV